MYHVKQSHLLLRLKVLLCISILLFQGSSLTYDFKDKQSYMTLQLSRNIKKFYLYYTYYGFKQSTQNISKSKCTLSLLILINKQKTVLVLFQDEEIYAKYQQRLKYQIYVNLNIRIQTYNKIQKVSKLGKKQTMENKFKLGYTLQCFKKINQSIQNNKQVPFNQFFEILNQFCFVFKELNSFLGIAFADVKEKSATIMANQQKFSGHPGLISFVKMQMQKKIHTYNSKNGKPNKDAPEQFKTYSSTARNLLRMMWLLTFIKVTFERMKNNPNQSLSSIFSSAYDAAFGNNHGWLLQKSAKVAMLASPDRLRFYEVILGHKADEKQGHAQLQKSFPIIIPVHDFLWKFYEENGLTKLQ